MTLRYLAALLGQGFAAAAASRRMFIVLCLTMCLNDLMWFTLWIIFFASVGQVKGWHLSEVALFQGMVVIGFGLAVFLADGTLKIGRRIVNGELDTYLTRPRHILPQLMTVQSEASGLGDILFGVILLLAFAHPGAAGLVLALAVAALIALLFLAIALMVQSLAFFFTGGPGLADQLLDMMICLGTTPQHTQPLAVKFILFSILPAGFMAILPVDIVRHESLGLLAVLALAVLGYFAAAVAFFNRGLRRYTSATGWSA